MKNLLTTLFLCLVAATAWADIPKPQDKMQALVMLYDAIRAAAPQMKVEIDEADISLKLTDADGRISQAYPDNLYLELMQTTSSDQRLVILDEHTDAFLQALMVQANVPALDQASLYPVLRPADMLPADFATAMPHKDFPGGLVEYWVEDTPSATSSVTLDNIAKADLSGDDLAAVALVNLGQKAKAVRVEHLGGIRMVVLDGYYESSLLLLPEIWTGLDKSMGSVVIAIPTRDLLLVADGSDAAQIAELRRVAKIPFKTYPYAITEQLLRWDADHWTVLPD